MKDPVKTDFTSLAKTPASIASLLGAVGASNGDGTVNPAAPPTESMFPSDVSAESLLGPYQQPQPQSPADNVNAQLLATIQGGIGDTSKLEGELSANAADANKRAEELRSEQQKASELSVQAAKDRTEYQRPFLDDIKAKFEEYQSRADAVQQNTQAAVEAQMQKWDAARLDAANTQIQDFFASRDTSGKVVGIISAALGGFANGLSGNPGAPTPLDRVIQRDLDIQIQNLNQKNRVAEGERSKLQVLMSNGLNQLEAISALRAGLNQKISIIAADVANRMGTQDAQARAAQIQADRDADIEKIRAATQSSISAQKIALESKKLALEAHQASLIGAVARGVMAQKSGLLDANVEGFPTGASPRDRTTVERMIVALQNAYDLVKKQDDNIAPIGNTNARTLLQNELATIYGGPNGAREIDFKRAEEVVGGRYTGILTDTASRRHPGLKDAAAHVRAALAGGTPKGQLAATLDKIDALE